MRVASMGGRRAGGAVLRVRWRLAACTTATDAARAACATGVTASSTSICSK